MSNSDRKSPDDIIDPALVGPYKAAKVTGFVAHMAVYWVVAFVGDKVIQSTITMEEYFQAAMLAAVLCLISWAMACKCGSQALLLTHDRVINTMFMALWGIAYGKYAYVVYYFASI